jgi:hypothetical protein
MVRTRGSSVMPTIGAKERGANSDKLLDRVGLVVETLAELAIASVLGARPVRQLRGVWLIPILSATRQKPAQGQRPAAVVRLTRNRSRLR